MLTADVGRLGAVEPPSKRTCLRTTKQANLANNAYWWLNDNASGSQPTLIGGSMARRLARNSNITGSWHIVPARA